LLQLGGTYAIVDSWKEHMGKKTHNAHSFLPADSVIGVKTAPPPQIIPSSS